MPRLFLLILPAVCLALLGGSFSADYALRHFAGFNGMEIGAWRAFPQNADGSADIYTRAAARRDKIIAYARAEGMGFHLAADSEGRALSGACRYQLEGQVPEARFFTLYPADKNGQWLQSGQGLPDRLFSQDILRMESGAFRIILSPRVEAGNWLAVPEGRYELQLNLYETPITAMTGFIKPQMPKLVRLKGDRCG